MKLKRKNIDPVIERKIELYINGKLDSQQIDDLWSDLIQDEDALDYLKTAANLKEIAAQESKAKMYRSIKYENRFKWYAVAAAIVLMIGSFGLLQMQTGADFPSVEPIANIELDYYRSAEVQTDVSDEEALIREAILLANEGNYQEAVDLLDSAIDQINDLHSKSLLYINAGSIYYNSSRYTEAADRFEKVTEIEESDQLVLERAYWYLGNTYFQLNMLEDARQAFEKAYELNGAYSRVAQSYLRALDSQ